MVIKLHLALFYKLHTCYSSNHLCAGSYVEHTFLVHRGGSMSAAQRLCSRVVLGEICAILANGMENEARHPRARISTGHSI
jgi:hypothetical protein